MANDKSKGKDETNYSEVFRQFVGPTLQNSDSIDQIKEKYAFGMHVWNAAAIKTKSPKMFENARNQVARKSTSKPEAITLFNELVNLKKTGFSRYKRVIVDFEIVESSNAGYDVSVATADLKAE